MRTWLAAGAAVLAVAGTAAVTLPPSAYPTLRPGGAEAGASTAVPAATVSPRVRLAAVVGSGAAPAPAAVGARGVPRTRAAPTPPKPAAPAQPAYPWQPPLALRTPGPAPTQPPTIVGPVRRIRTTVPEWTSVVVPAEAGVLHVVCSHNAGYYAVDRSSGTWRVVRQDGGPAYDVSYVFVQGPGPYASRGPC